MKPTDILREEHRAILRVLDGLDRLAADAASAGRVDAAGAARAIEFLRTFADAGHHLKEEKSLFPRLVERGAAPPVFVMLREHEDGRAMVRALDDASQAGDALAFRRAAADFSQLLRQHIAKEDHVLFPMAESLLSDQDFARISEEFAAAEAAEPPGVRARLLDYARA